jgi:hypothetical protein
MLLCSVPETQLAHASIHWSLDKGGLNADLDTWLRSSGALSALAIHSNARILSSFEAWVGSASASLSSSMALTSWERTNLESEEGCWFSKEV